MKIAIAADHGGFPLKASVAEWTRKLGHEVIDLGAHENDPLDDYPDFARAVGEAVSAGQADRGIVICGSGIGASIAANKFPGIRAAVCHDVYSAGQGVEHDDMNVLCIGARIIGVAAAELIVKAFLNTSFSPELRFARRLEKVIAIENTYMKR